MVITDNSVSFYNDKGKNSNDTLYLRTDKEIITLKTSFGLLQHTRGNIPGVLRLKLVKYDQVYNLIEQLKLNDKIISYYWMVNYTSYYGGNLIIGEPPHIFDQTHYKKENLEVFHFYIEQCYLAGD